MLDCTLAGLNCWQTITPLTCWTLSGTVAPMSFVLADHVLLQI